MDVSLPSHGRSCYFGHQRDDRHMGLGVASILQCGYAECRPDWWNRREWAPEPYAKVFVPIAGEAVYQNLAGSERLVPGKLYFFPPHQRSRHECRTTFDVHWMHISIDSPVLDARLTRMRAIASWPVAEWLPWKPVYSRLGDFAQQREESLELRLQAWILEICASLCERHPEADAATAMVRERFAGALQFMDAEFRRNPSLAEIAQHGGLSEAHFHRRFRETFHLTPHAYLLRRRMDLAQQLLERSTMTISEVGAACGYVDQFYFSRVFKRWSHLSPERYRAVRNASP
jgi:AraC-like DNA-binding protein